MEDVVDITLVESEKDSGQSLVSTSQSPIYSSQQQWRTESPNGGWLSHVAVRSTVYPHWPFASANGVAIAVELFNKAMPFEQS